MPSSTRLFQTATTKTTRTSTPDALETIIAYPKSTSEELFIRDTLQTNELFASLEDESLSVLIGAFEKFDATCDQVIVAQGDSPEDDYVYMILEGECKLKVDGKIIPPPYGRIQSGSIFGELGVLYNEKRAATVVARSDETILFRIQGDVFNNVLRSGASQSLDLEMMQEIDNVINQVSGTMDIYDGDIIPKYKPQRAWLWRQFTGTVIKISLNSILGNCLFCLTFTVLVEQSIGVADYHHPIEYFWTNTGEVVLPDKDIPLVQNLFLINKIWSTLQTFTTFILAFFINRAFGFWQSVYSDCRKIQNNLDGYFMLLSANVKRNDDGTFPPESAEFLEDVGQYSRLFHSLYWASVSKRFEVLKTPKGLQRMESRGLMTQSQLETLQGLTVTDNHLMLAPFEWMVLRTLQAMDKGIMADDTATRGQCLKKMGQLRDSYMAIPNALAGRMPLSYAHFVQIMVDTFVLLSPIALYPQLGAYSVFAVGLITLFNTGSLNLAKIFLDPLNNENFCEEDANFMDLAVLIKESNGASTRWKRVGEKLPFD